VRLLPSRKRPESLKQQKHLIQDYIEQHGWQFVGWYEEPEPSAAAEDRAPRPVFSRLLEEAGKDFQVVVCARNHYWSRNVPEALSALNRLRKMQVWWATADGVWDLDQVVNDGFDICFPCSPPRRKRAVSPSDTSGEERPGGR
jgi:DNA invertase Pin-like site-specific DNA recombinase